MQRTSIQGVGGAAVHLVPVLPLEQRGRLAIQQDVVKLAEMEGFDLVDDGEGGWHWVSASRKRELLRALPETNDSAFVTKADAAYDAISVLGAVLDAHFPRHCAPSGPAS